MKGSRPLRNGVREARVRLGLSQQELARAAGVTRQTIGGIEAGLYQPSVAVAMRIARVLGAGVEDLFWLDDEVPRVQAVMALPPARPASGRVSLARVGGRWVAYPLGGERAFRTEVVPVDGLVEEGEEAGDEGRVAVRLVGGDVEDLERGVVIAGCSPALGLWAREAERRHPGLRVQWLHANSTQALELLAKRLVHVAGVHLRDPATGEYNVSFVRRALPGRAVSLIHLGTWREGLAVWPGNPKGLRGAADLARPGVRVVNRERGAGARALLEEALRTAGVPGETVQGLDRVVFSHQEVAREVARGAADAGVVPAAVAAAYALDFVPLQEARFDVAIPDEWLTLEPVRQLLATLSLRALRRQLELAGGFTTERTGELVARVVA
ncbi:MAG: helix-turn-helix domain-containing protein [Limnochordaceae bacterium]|nr:helix-turn-helix domain-containing protein [Limnochordaceae bacterium]